MAGDDFRVEWLARSLMRQQEAAGAERPAARSYRLSRVPSHVRLANPDAYTPKFVAVGPLHRDDRRLHPANRLKMSYLHNLISRGLPDPAHHFAAIQSYVRRIAAQEREARAFYTEGVGLEREEFVQMLVLDGCFVIEHLVNHATGRVEPELHATPFGPAQLSLDLVLLENQLPFFVLVDLIAATRLPEFESPGFARPAALLVELAVRYLVGDSGRALISALPPAEDVAHLLHLLHAAVTVARKRWVAPPPIVAGAAQAAGRMLRRLPLLLLVPLLYPILPEERKWRASYGRDDVPCASDLKRMQVRFKKTRAASAAGAGIAALLGSPPLAVELADEDTLRMPQLLVEFRTVPLLLNLVALEQSLPDLPDDVSAFVSFMAKIVQSAEDAGVLVAAEVVHITSDSKERVASSLRQVGGASSVELERSYLALMLEKLRERSAHPLFMMWADVQRNYFTVPWAVVAEFVALVSFVATVLQTYTAFRK